MAIIVVNKVNEDLQGRTGDAFKNNAFDTIKTTFTLELDTKLVLNSFLAVSVVKVGDVYTLTSGNWKDLIGAFVGASVDYSLAGGATYSETILSVNGATMELTSGLGAYADDNYTVGWFQVTNDPEQFGFDINLVENSTATGTASLIDGEAVRFLVVLNLALTISGGADTFEQLGNKSGGSIFAQKTISRLADSTINGNKRYQLIVKYKNWVAISPTPYSAAGAIGDYYLFSAFMITNDPSSVVTGSQFQTGNTGLENENFNGVAPDYTLTSIVWTDDSANVMDSFDFGQPSNFSIVIAGSGLSVADKFNFKMFMLPNDSSEYSNLPTPIENNVMLAINVALIPDSTPTLINGNINSNGSGIDVSSVTFTVTAGVSVTVTGKVTPNAAFIAEYEAKDIADRFYKIWVQSEDITLPYKASNTVNVLADFQNSVENIQPLGKLTTVSTLEMEDHNGDVYALTPDPYLEDDCLVNVEYTLPKDIVNNPWVSVRMRVVAVKASTGERFTLEEFIYDTSNLPVNTTTGILPLDYTQNRGFKLPSTSDKHDITVKLFPSLDTASAFGVQVRYPFITRYESWLPMPQAANDFFAANSQNWYPYSSSATWSVQFEIAHEVSNGEYIDDLPFTIHDYNDWGDASAITFEELDGNPITRPFSDHITKVIATHTVDTEDWNGSEWGLIHVRPKFGAPQWLMGTVLDWSDLNNPLRPLVGETRAKKTVTTKVVTIEAFFDPSLIDVSGDLTFTTRVNGSTTLGLRANIYKEIFRPAKSPIKPQTRGGAVVLEENRGLPRCCEPFLKLADTSDDVRYKNDVTAVYDFADSMTVLVLKDGVDTGFVVTTEAFPAQLDARYAQIEWRDVASAHGFGCYSITVEQTIAGSTRAAYVWAEYEVMPYMIGSVGSGEIYMGEGTARVLSQFNNMNYFVGINMTGSFMLDSIRLRGKAGYNQPNTIVDNVEYQNGKMETVSREDFETYELRTSLIMIEDVQALRLHVLSETTCWLSDHNFDSPDYFFFDKPVIVQEGYVPEYYGGTRAQSGVVIFEDKEHSKRAAFQENRQTSEVAQAPILPTVIVTPVPVGAKLIKTGQTTSYATGDDGDLQEGRETDFFTLASNNPFGNTLRFTDTLGGTTYADGIRLDWARFDGSTVLGWRITDNGVNINWSDANTNAQLLTVDIFTTGWRLPNRFELDSIRYSGSNVYFNYTPLNETNNYRWWTGGSWNAASIYAVCLPNRPVESSANLKTSNANMRYYPCRNFTVTGTTLT